MSADLDLILSAEMSRWEGRGLRRDLDAQTRDSFERRFDFASNDSLSLATDPRVIDAAREAIGRFGAGGRAARLLGGGCVLDREAESAVAEWLGAESALLFPTGFQANAGIIGALAGPGDVLLSDEWNHASIVDAARSSRARVLVHRHGDLDHVAWLLRATREARFRVVVTESVFSMDGDVAPLLDLHELCAAFEAFLVVDEAHAVGLIGPSGAGGWRASDPDGSLARGPESRLAGRVVTGGKALGVTGAFVVGSRALREHVANRARSFVFTTAVSPAVSGALCAAIDIARRDDGRRARALQAATSVARTLDLPAPAAAIVPVVVGSADEALALARTCRSAGLDVRAVRPPTVPEGAARLRVVGHAHNDDEALETLCARVKPMLRSRAVPVVSRPRARVLCVTGTDTDVGKTVVSAVLARFASRAGPTSYWKPIQTGEACDSAEVARLVGATVTILEPRHRFPLPASPHAAAAAAGASVDFEALRAQFATARARSEGTLVVEMAGGLLVPYDDIHTQADLLARERPDIVLVARSGLGTLNHTLLTVEALVARAIPPIAVFLVGPRHESNAATLRARLQFLRVFELSPLEPLDARAIDDWLEHHDLRGLIP